jgi:hypothetical protein
MTEPYRNADTRIREAFAALRAEITSIFGEQPRLTLENTEEEWEAAPLPAAILAGLPAFEEHLHRYAKQPASEG